jgi:hypothetical protein
MGIMNDKIAIRFEFLFCVSFLLLLLLLGFAIVTTQKKTRRMINSQKDFLTVQSVYQRDLPFGKHFYLGKTVKDLYPQLQTNILLYWFPEGVSVDVNNFLYFHSLSLTLTLTRFYQSFEKLNFYIKCRKL